MTPLQKNVGLGKKIVQKNQLGLRICKHKKSCLVSQFVVFLSPGCSANQQFHFKYSWFSTCFHLFCFPLHICFLCSIRTQMKNEVCPCHQGARVSSKLCLTCRKCSSWNPLHFPPPTITVWNEVWKTPPLSSLKPLQGSLVKACVGKKEHYTRTVQWLDNSQSMKVQQENVLL